MIKNVKRNKKLCTQKVNVRIYVKDVKTASGIANVYVETKNETIVYNWSNLGKYYNMYNSKNLMKLPYQVLKIFTGA